MVQSWQNSQCIKKKVTFDTVSNFHDCNYGNTLLAYKYILNVFPESLIENICLGFDVVLTENQVMQWRGIIWNILFTSPRITNVGKMNLFWSVWNEISNVSTGLDHALVVESWSVIPSTAPHLQPDPSASMRHATGNHQCVINHQDL